LHGWCEVRGILLAERRPIYLENEGYCDGRASLHGPDGAQSAASDGTALVLPKPFPRDARQASLRRMHGFVNGA
jgi:hypothetical protein